MAVQLGDGLIKFSLDFITKTSLGKLKAAEIVFTLLAGACGLSVLSYIHCNCNPKVRFFNSVAWTALINALIDMVIHLIGLWERLYWIFRHPALFLVLCILADLGFLIGSSLVASCSTESCVKNPKTAAAAAFFGFVCLVLFAVETYFNLKLYRGMEEEAKQQSSGQSKGPDYVEPPMDPPPPYTRSGGIV